MARVILNGILAALVVSIFMVGGATAHPPWGIGVDRQGQVYFSDLETIWKIDISGKLTVFRPGASGRHTHDLTVDEEGNLYGEELTYESSTQRYISALWRMTPTGDFKYTLPPTYDPPKGISIWKDRDGNTYSVDWKSNAEHETLILKRAPDGKLSLLFGNPETADRFRQVVLYSVGGIAFGPDGTLYVADGASVRKITAGGVVSTLASGLTLENSTGDSAQKGGPTLLLGIAADAKGNVFAADHGNRRVLKVSPDGKLETLYSAEQTWEPTGVAFRNGDLYILEFRPAPAGKDSTARVRKLSPDGKTTILATTNGEDSNTAAGDLPYDNANPQTRTGRYAMYALMGLAAFVVALAVAIRRLRRNTAHQRPSE